MGELTIRPDRRFPTVRSQAAVKGGKTAGSEATQGAAKTAFTVSETLQQLMRTDSRTVRQSKETLRTLQNGEGALAELQDSMERLGELARRAAEGGPADREALQGELEQLQEKMERILNSGVSLLPGSGGDAGAGDRLAVLYLGAVIAGGGELPAQISPEQALEGLELLLAKAAEGMDPDQAVALLTDGRFTSLAEFRAWFAGGDIPGMQALLEGMLSPGGLSPTLPDLSALLPLLEVGGTDQGLMDQLLTALKSLPTPPEGAQAGGGGQGMSNALPVMRAGGFQAAGRDLSGLTFQETDGRLTVGGRSDVTVGGTEQQGGSIVLTGSGTVTLRDVRAALLTAASPEARIFTAGETAVGELRLEAGTVLTVDGSGPLRVGAFQAEQGALLRLAEGASVMPGKPGEEPVVLTAPVVLEGTASLAATARAGVRSADGKALDPFDLVWETLLPGWKSVTSAAVDGKQARMALLRGDPARLWLTKGEHGCDVHELVLQGQDEAGRPQTRYAYLVWNQKEKKFEEPEEPVPECGNPFSVTGGEPGEDWVYEEETRTLRILSNRVTAVSGGDRGEDEMPFSGRIALADGIGYMRLTLEGVVCRAAAGSAFDLGRENDVTLILRDGTDSRFESGPGWAGISLGDGACLRVERSALEGAERGEEGSLTATGGAGAAGIGRDSGGSRDRTSTILIVSGTVTAVGGSAAAGIGAGQHSAMGAITIVGGTVVSTGGTGGGAGIGGALDAAAGDIQIKGGRITAEAAGHAADIGAGVQGACGDILITGTARILKAPDIGACPLGGCGRVTVSGGADIGQARLRTQADGFPEGEEEPPQFRLTLEGLGLDRLRVRTLEEAQKAVPGVDKALRRLAALRRVYGEMYARAERRYWQPQGDRMPSGGAVRDAGAADKLLGGLKREAHQAVKAHGRPEEAGELLKG